MSRKLLPWVTVLSLGTIIGSAIGAAASGMKAPRSFVGSCLVEITSPGALQTHDDVSYATTLATAEPVVRRALDELRQHHPESLRSDRSATIDGLGQSLHASLASANAIRIDARAEQPADAHVIAVAVADALQAELQSREPAPAKPDSHAADLKSLETQLASLAAPEDAQAIDEERSRLEATLTKFEDESASVQIEQRRTSQRFQEQIHLLQIAMDSARDAKKSPTTAPVDPVAATIEHEYLDAMHDYLSHIAAGRTDAHPDVIVAKSRLERLEKMRRPTSTTQETPESEPIATSRKIYATCNEIGARNATLIDQQKLLELDLAKLNERRSGLLARRATSLDLAKQRETLTAKIAETQVAIAKAEAIVPEPVSTFRVLPLTDSRELRDYSKLPMLAAIAGGIGLLVAGASLAFVSRSSKHEQATDDHSLESLFDAPIITTISAASGGYDAVAPHERRRTLDGIASVREAILRARDQRPMKVVGIIAILPGAGATGITVALGTLIARSLRLTCVIDANVVSPAVHEKLGLPSAPGWLDVVGGKASIHSALHRVNEDPWFNAIVAGQIEDNADDLAASDRRLVMLKRAAEYYDTVLVDLPPLASGSCATTQLRGLDGVILCLSGHEPAHILRMAASDLRTSGTPVLGLVRNKKHFSRRSGQRARPTEKLLA